ncbi:hypothetical protein NDU88_003360 [Pleurodeles waltl]|uniref:Uncharacterized protein n=1 Tax=Pleurodeles waltl TaxID=8319 RepID=A0AAV7SFP7_PLEWA|nr:hypothetical protein NDU88_003360 [Pleurodeles waltl]
MTEWLPFEEEEIEFGFEDALGPQLGAGLSEVINASVQQSLSRALAVSVPQRINRAVLAALKPLTQQFDSFVKKQGLAPLPEEKVREGPETATTPQVSSWPHDGALSALAKGSADHVYCSLPSTSKGPLLEVADSSDSDSTSSKSSHSSGTLRKRKRARKSSSSQSKERSHSPSNPFQFNPEDIIHPRSADWAPAEGVADYLHDKLWKGFDKEVRNRLRAECPRPEIPDKVAETPDIDPSMLTFLKKFAKDPKKGIDRAWRSCQDKLLDLAGPLAKILEMALRAKESGEPIDPHTLAEWT